MPIDFEARIAKTFEVVIKLRVSSIDCFLKTDLRFEYRRQLFFRDIIALILLGIVSKQYNILTELFNGYIDSPFTNVTIVTL